MLKSILNLVGVQELSKIQQKNIIAGATQCWTLIQYDDGYTYSVSQGDDIAGCRKLVNTSYEDSFGTFTVKDCHCTGYA